MMQNSINAVLIDDEEGSIATLQILLSKYCLNINVLGTFNNPLKAVTAIPELRPDILFLDIEMPFANGFELLDRLAPVDFEVIFVTAFNSYALKAIKYAAIDYILKPVSIDELVLAVDKASKQSLLRKQQNGNIRIEALLENLRNSNAGSQKITLPTPNGFEVEETNSIIYIEASGSYSKLIMVSGKKILVSKSLKDFEELLPIDDFIRVHHSYMVNKNHVLNYHKGRGGFLLLSNGDEVEVAVRKKNEVLSRFGQ